MTSVCKDNRDCDDLPGSQCYNSSVLRDCCHTCEDHEVQLPIADCKYGNHIDTCDVQDGRQCYNTTVLKQCCATCHGYDTQIPDCKYGNKKPSCRVELCSNYTLVDRADCCKTCKGLFINNTQQATTGMPRTTLGPTLEGPGAVTEGLKNKADTESLPDWVVPTITTGGLALLVLAVILAVFILRRSRKRSAAKSSSLSMATVDSNLSHRAPAPLPRPDSTKAESVREQTPSEEYDYIGQEYIEHAGRNDPLPLAPREYLTWDDPNAPYRRVLCSKELNDLHDDVANPTVYTSAPKNRHQFDEVEGKVVPNGKQSPYEASEYARLESSQREARRLNTYKLFPTLKGTEEHQTEEQQSMRE
ncbi:hypothetical protein DPMN_148222 [Dreissena polymorpha]|uniref:Uncharacterized protein n=1 Tax=Dreissena polymorpha TaxID=45954 RepID=A0A9D4FBF8_DREPO|nr:hypothetical protein DPMN_148222 [Dreissena polymorpha]